MDSSVANADWIAIYQRSQSRASRNLIDIASSWHAGLGLRAKSANRGGSQTLFFQNSELACAAHQSDAITCGVFHGLQLACCAYTCIIDKYIAICVYIYIYIHMNYILVCYYILLHVIICYHILLYIIIYYHMLLYIIYIYMLLCIIIYYDIF